MQCAICKSPILKAHSIKTCEICKYDFHLECWKENGGCGTPGCANLPHVSKDQTDYSNIKSAWGGETRSCPACAEFIQVNARECPFCHEVFSNEPLSLIDEPSVQLDPIHKRIAVVVFVIGLLGITAPFNLIFGGIWYLNKRNMLKQASPMHHLLAIIGLSISCIYMLLFIIGILIG